MCNIGTTGIGELKPYVPVPNHEVKRALPAIQTVS